MMKAKQQTYTLTNDDLRENLLRELWATHEWLENRGFPKELILAAFEGMMDERRKPTWTDCKYPTVHQFIDAVEALARRTRPHLRLVIWNDRPHLRRK